MHLTRPFIMKPFTFNYTQRLSKDCICVKLKKSNIDTNLWKYNIDFLDDKEFYLYKKITASMLKNASCKESIYEFINIIQDLKVGDINKCNHCYDFLCNLDTFNKVRDKILYMTLYKKALFSEDVV